MAHYRKGVNAKMPDWISHVLVGLIICELFNIKRKSLVLIGVLLPDLLLKFKMLSLFNLVSEGNVFWALVPFHSPAGLLLLTVLIIPIFRFDKIKAFSLISIGWVSHILVDITHRHIMYTSMYVLIPFSWANIELKWLWPDKYYVILAITIVAYVLVKVIKAFILSRTTHYR
jgi:hypothetical protein